MLSPLFNKLVPGNMKGKPTDLENTKTFISKSEAQEAFKRAYKRMLNVTIRNEVINTETEKIKDRLRNTIVGAGAMVGISELQWSALIKSFLEREV